MPATMKDIAVKAGISRQTVSLILNGHADRLSIAKGTQRRVREIAEELGYCRNELANAVKRGHSNVIGFFGGGGLHILDFLDGISRELHPAGFSINCCLPHYQTRADEAEAFAKTCISQMIPAVISTLPMLMEPVLDTFDKHNIKLVFLNTFLLKERYSVVHSDEMQGAALAVEHLAGLGHRRIGILTVATENTYSQNRKNGYLHGLKRFRLDFEPELEFHTTDTFQYKEQERDAFREYLRKSRPTAMLAVSDAQAAKILMYAQELRIHIPHELSVVSFSNVTYTEFSAPPLTAVAEPLKQIGAEAAKIVLNSIGKKDHAVQDIGLPCRLIVRKSTERIEI